MSHEHITAKPRLLRGEKLVKAALDVLARWVNLSPKTHPINVYRLAQELNVTRQAIYNNGLKPIVIEHKSLQLKNFSIEQEGVIQRKPLEERIAAQNEEISNLHRVIDGWIEWCAAVEYNAKMLGIDPDKLFAPLAPPIKQKMSAFRKS